jgi:hypothetical protein
VNPLIFYPFSTDLTRRERTSTHRSRVALRVPLRILQNRGLQVRVPPAPLEAAQAGTPLWLLSYRLSCWRGDRYVGRLALGSSASRSATEAGARCTEGSVSAICGKKDPAEAGPQNDRLSSGGTSSRNPCSRSQGRNSRNHKRSASRTSCWPASHRTAELDVTYLRQTLLLGRCLSTVSEGSLELISAPERRSVSLSDDLRRCRRSLSFR